MKNGKFLVVVDVQNDFVSGSLGTKEAQAMLPNLVKKIKEKEYDYIIFTRDTHTNDYLFTKEGEKLPVKHCIFGTKGWELCDELKEWSVKREWKGSPLVNIINKPTFGSTEEAYGDPSLISWMKTIIQSNSIDEFDVEIVGLCTDICVISNALAIKSAFYDYADITVDSSCCAGVTPEKHEAALEVMRSCQINVI